MSRFCCHLSYAVSSNNMTSRQGSCSAPVSVVIIGVAFYFNGSTNCDQYLSLGKLISVVMNCRNFKELLAYILQGRSQGESWEPSPPLKEKKYYCCFTNSFERKQQQNATAPFPKPSHSFILQSSPRNHSVRRDRIIFLHETAKIGHPPPPPFITPRYVPDILCKLFALSCSKR